MAKAAKKKKKENQVFDPKSKHYFPNYFRFITEKKFTVNSVGEFLVKALFAVVIIAVIVVSVDLFITLFKSAYTKTQYVELQQQQQYWRRVVKEYPQYRDGYLQLSAIDYQLGNKNLAKQELDQALQFDPNDNFAQQLQAQIGE